MIGLLMYLMNTRTNICFAVNTLSQYLVEPIHVHLVASKHVLRYLKETLDYDICYTGDCDFRLYGYTDSDWDGSSSDIKSTSGCCFNLGSVMTSWKEGSNPIFLLVWKKWSTLEHGLPIVKPYGFRSC
jgi:hypothetical protein